MSVSQLLAIVNESTVVSNDEVKAAVPAYQKFVSNYIKKFWNVGAIVRFYDDPKKVPKHAWVVAIMDDSDQAGALGYHEMTPQGLPQSLIFAKTDQQYGYNRDVTATHEIAEMLLDPFLARVDQVSDAEAYAEELGDPVEADKFALDIDGIKCSDFITPEWFQPGSDGPWDAAGHCTRALQVLEGGYVSILNLRTGQWSQKTTKNGELVDAEEDDNPYKDGDKTRFRDRSPKLGI